MRPILLLSLVLSTTLLVSCGEKLDSLGKDEGAERRQADRRPNEVELVPSGRTGAIPTEGGFVFVDMAKIEALAESTRLCAADKIYAVDGKFASEFKPSDEIGIAGWLLNPQRKAPEKFALLLVGEGRSYAVAGETGKQRADVARVHKSAAARYSGYSVKAALSGVSSGEYAISLLQDTHGKVTVCTTKKRIVVVGS